MRKIRTKPKTTKKILYYPKKGYKNAIRVLKLLAKEEMLSTKQIGMKLSAGEYSQKQTKDKMEFLAQLGYCTEYRVVRNTDHACENCKESTKYFLNASSVKGCIEAMKNWPKEKQKEGHIIGQMLGFNCFSCGKYLQGHKTEYYKIQQDRLWDLSINGKAAMLGLLSGQKLYDFIEKQIHLQEFELLNALLRSNRKDLSDRLIGVIKKNMDVDSSIFKYMESWFDEVKLEVHTLNVDETKYPDLANFKEKHYFDLQMAYADELNRKVKIHR